MNTFGFGEWTFGIQDEMASGRTLAALWRKNPDGTRDVFCWNGTVQRVPQDKVTPEKGILNLDRSMLQGMMDGLWGLGIRPNDKRYEEEAKLRDAHLQDMRKIVFKDFAA